MMENTADRLLLDAVTKATCQAVRDAEIRLPGDVYRAIVQAAGEERDEIARGELANILANIARAEDLKVPICQDTGIFVIYVTIPPGIPYTLSLVQALHEGVRRATGIVPLRPNVVSPLQRENSGDNTGSGMPAIHVRPGPDLTITVLPKGAGAENMSRIAMMLPSGHDQIARFVVETMLIAGGRPCPPVILGVGIGSTFDGVAALAKEALLLPVDRMDPFEQELCDAVNSLGIGPMGLGGDTTALAVKVKQAGCHTASLPIAVNVQCWASRRATITVDLKKSRPDERMSEVDRPPVKKDPPAGVGS
jgi:fumarate hydratase subunit alpha